MARKWFSEDGKCNSNKMTKVMLNYRPTGQIQLGGPLKRDLTLGVDKLGQVWN